jgi:SAM-dependent methyltransferase
VTEPLPPAFVGTTRRDARADEEEAARAAARRWGVAFRLRAGASLPAIVCAAQVEAALVLSAARATLFLDGVEHPWDAGMAALRLKRLRRGEAGPQRTADPFLEAAALRAGDAVLDATLGRGMDALVAAEAVGPGGRVVGVEASPLLAALTAEGLARCDDRAARRIEVVAGEAGGVLAALPDRSFDVVVFDPMFRSPRAAGAGFDLVRRLADARPLALETLARARRVARRWVVVKDGTPGWDLARLGLVPLPCARWAEKLYARAGGG